MEESNWIPSIVIAIIAASPGVFALMRQWRKDSQDARNEERQVAIKSRLDLDRAAWTRASETMEKQEKKITELEDCIEDLENRLAESDTRIKQLELDINKYELIMENKDKRILDLEKKLKEALKENDTLKKKLGEYKE